MPDKLKELQTLFLAEAAKYNVFPLDNTAFSRLLTPRPSAVAGKTVFTYTGENAGIPLGNAPSILDKDYTITAEVTVPKGGAEGMIVTLGGHFGGYALYLLKGKPVFVYNLLDLERFRWEGGIGGVVGEDWFGRALQPGKHTLVFDFKYDGPGPGKGGTGVLTVDGKELARKTIAHTIPLMMAIDETFDVGVDTRTTVDGSYKLPFRFTGTIDKLTFKLGPEQLTAADEKAAADAVARAMD
jgi:arylsulfatase